MQMQSSKATSREKEGAMARSILRLLMGPRAEEGVANATQRHVHCGMIPRDIHIAAAMCRMRSICCMRIMKALHLYQPENGVTDRIEHWQAQTLQVSGGCSTID